MLLLVYGLVVGVSLGLTGGGGSIITVPLLVYVVGEGVQDAIATSLVIVGAVALSAFLTRLRQADIAAGCIVGFAGLLGAIPGRLAAQFFSGRLLLLLFALIMLVAASAMFRSKTYANPNSQRNWLLVLLAGVGLGFLTGFLGVGGGFLIVPVLVLLLGMQMPTAIPTSLLVITLNCSAALAGGLVLRHSPQRAGDVHWVVALLFIIGGMAGGALGAAIARRLEGKMLKRVFALFVFCVGLFVAASAAGLVPLRVQ
ncbi:MAG: sulfite exporter TauE/SafE family protein [Candidatus Eremiobacteraeota bacterium]|nr:sulfite exporter TauE/SafE family protein [Candidatus Eremiobacteraeota bacterium]